MQAFDHTSFYCMIEKCFIDGASCYNKRQVGQSMTDKQRRGMPDS